MHRLLPSLCISSPLFSIDSLLSLHCLSSSHFPRFSTCIRHGHPFYTNHASIPSSSLSYIFQLTFLVTYVYGMLRLTSNSLPSPNPSSFLTVSVQSVSYLFHLYFFFFHFCLFSICFKRHLCFSVILVNRLVRNFMYYLITIDLFYRIRWIFFSCGHYSIRV